MRAIWLSTIPGTVILHDHARFPVAFADLHADIGQYPRFLAGIERVIHRLLNRGDQCLGGGIKTEQMTILEKELRNRNVALATRHFDCGGRWGLVADTLRCRVRNGLVGLVAQIQGRSVLRDAGRWSMSFANSPGSSFSQRASNTPRLTVSASSGNCGGNSFRTWSANSST